MLLLSLAVGVGLERAGAVEGLTHLLAPALDAAGVDPAYILPTFTKYLAGSTALLGVEIDMAKGGRFGPHLVNGSAGFLLHPLDLPGVAILVSAGARVGRTLPAALGGSCAGIALRTFAGILAG